MESNTDIIKRLYSAFASGDFQALKELCSVNIRWEQMPGFPDGGIYIGPDEIISHVFNRFKQDWYPWKAVVHAFAETDNQVFVQGYYEGTYRKTGKAMKAGFLHCYGLVNNKVVHFKQYTDTKVIADAMQNNMIS